MEPEHYPNRILLCVTGLSPQIITETLYALAVGRQRPFVPSEIHLLTTAEGAIRAELTLLDPDQGYFPRLCEDYGLDAQAMCFGPDTIHVIRSKDGAPLADIRSPDDNEATADLITATVRRLTANPENAVHASIAGGRKTMGFYLGYAMSLFGRPQDRLSHVLVSAPFESLSDFFFPPRKPRLLYTQGPNSRPIHTRDAVVTLADIPFVRLRDGLPEHLLEGAASFSATVRQAQHSLGPPELVLDLASLTACCGGIPVELRPAELAFLVWLARRALAGKPGVCRTDISREETQEFLAEYRLLHNELSADYERVEKAVGETMDCAYFDQRLSLLHKRLRKALGTAGARAYRVVSDKRRPRSRYALNLAPSYIFFAASNTESKA